MYASKDILTEKKMYKYSGIITNANTEAVIADLLRIVNTGVSFNPSALYLANIKLPNKNITMVDCKIK